MHKVTINDIVGRTRYEHIRDQFRHHIIEVKKLRRVGVGDLITFVFENQDTVKFQIQEMLRAEHITDLANQSVVVQQSVLIMSDLSPAAASHCSTGSDCHRCHVLVEKSTSWQQLYTLCPLGASVTGC